MRAEQSYNILIIHEIASAVPAFYLERLAMIKIAVSNIDSAV